jgi:hypothetical protein
MQAIFTIFINHLFIMDLDHWQCGATKKNNGGRKSSAAVRGAPRASSERGRMVAPCEMHLPAPRFQSSRHLSILHSGKHVFRSASPALVPAWLITSLTRAISRSRRIPSKLARYFLRAPQSPAITHGLSLFATATCFFL